MITIFIIVPDPLTILNQYSGGYIMWARLTKELKTLGYNVYWLYGYHNPPSILQSPLLITELRPFSKYLNCEVEITTENFSKNFNGKKYIITGGFGIGYLQHLCKQYKSITYFWCHGDLIRYHKNKKAQDYLEISSNPILLCNSLLEPWL